MQAGRRCSAGSSSTASGPAIEPVPAPKNRDLELTRQQLVAWLSSRIPDARELRVSALRGPGDTGFSSDTLLFDLSWRQGGDEWSQSLVLRLEPRAFPIFPVYDMARQFLVQRRLWKTEVPVARVLWLEEEDKPLGAPFYVMERVEGRVPPDNPPYHVEGWVTRIEPGERARIWWSGLEAMARIHRLDARAPRYAFLREPDGCPLERQLGQYARFLAWAAQGREQPTCEAALAWLRRERPPQTDPPAICWGDARLGNQVFLDGRCVAVLDWEMVTLGDPEQDLAWFLFFDRHHSAGVDAPRLPGFPSPEETVARYEEWTGRTVRHLRYYEVFAAFRFSVIMIRVARQLQAFGLLPEDSGFERDNTATRMLAGMLDLPQPGAGG
jgi:aminoglycoside phosphotransferase (APT) family kinase protein